MLTFESGCSEGATCSTEFGYCHLPYVEFDYNYIPEVSQEQSVTKHCISLGNADHKDRLRKICVWVRKAYSKSLCN